MSASRVLAVVLAAGVILPSAGPAAAAVPDTSITSGPTGLIAKRSVTFRFSANIQGATFQCKLDDKAWKSCESPQRYSRLQQGPHKFRVRALKGGAIDPSPATRAFTVDTVKPNTTILSGPSGVIEDHSPSFTFSSTEPGSFECRLTSPGFKPCSSPFVPPTPLPDDSYTFKVRARDAAGNADATPASKTFGVETPLTQTLETAEAAAELYFPDGIGLDVPASCGSASPIDCPGGNALPPADQLSVASTRSVVEVAGQNRYDVTVTSDVTTLQPIKIMVPIVGDCDLTMTSANGTIPTWRNNVSLSFVTDPTSGELGIVPTNLTISQVEAADVILSGSFSCEFASLGIGFFVDNLTSTLEDNILNQAAYGLCAAPGPAYLGPCPEP